MSAKISIRTALLAVVTGFLVSPTLLFAQYQVVVGRQSTSTIGTVVNGNQVLIAVDPGSSYCCETLTAAPNSIFFSSNVVEMRSSGSPSGSVTGRFAGSDSPRLFDGWARLCFVVPSTMVYPSATLTMGTIYSSITNVQVYCDETTLYGGFNTSITDFNFLEITNTLQNVSPDVADRTLNLTLTAVNTVPDPDVTVINQESFTVAAGTRRDINIHERAGSGAFGTLRLAHNGSPGAIKAVLSQYNIVSVTPALDFAPVAQDVLRVRGESAGPVR
jgi:hypothetical protein